VAHENDKQYGDILSSCKGVVFMGTPHRGSSLAFWAATASTIINTASLSNALRSDLLRNLEQKSTVLREVSRQFIPRVDNVRIVSFFERNAMPGLKTPVCLHWGIFTCGYT
jgi:hypothetical protein